MEMVLSVSVEHEGRHARPFGEDDHLRLRAGFSYTAHECCPSDDLSVTAFEEPNRTTFEMWLGGSVSLLEILAKVIDALAGLRYATIHSLALDPTVVTLHPPR